jgi:hypothetical protein
MGRRVLSILLIILTLVQAIHAQDTQSNEPISEAQAFLQEMQANSTDEENSYNNDLSPQQRFEENPKHNVHEYNYKQQVIVGGAIMFCVALSLIVNNNYNPKRGK